MVKQGNRSSVLALVISALLIGGSSGLVSAEGGKIPVTTSSDEARQQYMQGFALAQHFQGSEAAKHFQKAVDLDPDFALAHLGLATTSPTAKEFFEHLGKAVSLAPKASEGERLWILGIQEAANGNPHKSKELYLKLVALHPDDEQAHSLLGGTYFFQQDYAGAIAEFEKAVKANPQHGPGYNMLGYAHRQTKNYKEAEKAFKKYTELLPDNPNPYDSYAELLLKMGRFDDSIAQYKKALVADPHFVASNYGIASNLTYQGKHEEARKELEKAYETALDDGQRRGLLNAVALTYVDQGQIDKALETVQKSYALAEKIQDAADMAQDLNLMGVILVESGKPDEAQRKFETALKLIEDSTLSIEVKADAMRLGNQAAARVALARHDLGAAKAKAKEFTDQATEMNNIFQIRSAHRLAGMIALEEKDHATAIAELKQASQQDPYTLYKLAEAYEGTGDAASARAMYEEVAKFNSLSSVDYAFVRNKALQKLSSGS